MWAYYNEHDPEAAEWLRELIAQGLIADGEVDERSIEDVTPDDVQGFMQCHFFAGIGLWSLALRRAGWADDRFVWTGSCPCQPFSTAGQKNGFADERHLWPTWYWLIEQCSPPVIFGEQVASKSVDPWIDVVQSDLEAMDYAVGAVPFPAAGVGAPNIRDRLYWVADAAGGGERRHWERKESKTSPSRRRRTTDAPRYWDAIDPIECADGRTRPSEPGILPLAHGHPQNVGRLRAYGNSLNPIAAQAFIECFIESTNDIDRLEAFERGEFLEIDE